MKEQEAEATFVPPFIPYAGNKNKYISDLMTIFPDEINTFVDLFGGTGVVGLNAWANGKIKHLVYNDVEVDLSRIVEILKIRPIEQIIEEQEEILEDYFDDRTKFNENDKETWVKIRQEYNDTLKPLYLTQKWVETNKSPRYSQHPQYDGQDYALIGGNLNLLLFLVRTTARGLISFNREFEYTGNFELNEHRKLDNYENLVCYSQAIHEADPEIYSINGASAYIRYHQHRMKWRTPEEQERFVEILLNLGENDLVYVDPPYFGSGWTYSSGWGFTDEIFLISLLEALDQQGTRWVLSNNLQYDNQMLRYLGQKHCCWIAEESYQSIKNYKEKAIKNGYEIIITNRKELHTKKKTPDGWIRVNERQEPIEWVNTKYHPEREHEAKTEQGQKAKRGRKE